MRENRKKGKKSLWVVCPGQHAAQATNKRGFPQEPYPKGFAHERQKVKVRGRRPLRLSVVSQQSKLLRPSVLDVLSLPPDVVRLQTGRRGRTLAVAKRPQREREQSEGKTKPLPFPPRPSRRSPSCPPSSCFSTPPRLFGHLNDSCRLRVLRL